MSSELTFSLFRYWSSWSPKWYEVTLSDLGMQLVCKFREEKKFLDKIESTWYYLYTKSVEKSFSVDSLHSSYGVQFSL